MWIAGEVLTASDLNAEYNNILTNGADLILPFTASVDFDANDLVLDGDGDTTIDASTDDRITFTLGSAEGAHLGHATGNTGAFFHLDPGAKTVTASTDFGILRVGNTNAITVPAGTTAVAAGVYIEAPNWTATGTITASATLYIVGPATEATTDYALFVDDGTVRIDGTIELGNATDTTLARASAGDVNIEGNIIYRAGGTDVVVADGGTGVSTLTDGGVLLGSGAGPLTAMAVLADGEFIVGDGTTDPVAESGATARTSLGLGTAALLSLAQADQAAMEAETNEDTYAPPDLIKHNPGVAKAWLKFEQVATQTIAASHNITSIADGGGVGQTDIVIATDFSSGDYGIAGICGRGAAGTGGIKVFLADADPAAGTLSIRVTDSADAGFDAEWVSLTMFGDQ